MHPVVLLLSLLVLAGCSVVQVSTQGSTYRVELQGPATSAWTGRA